MINGSVELSWGDGDHVFNIAVIAQMLELEEKCDAGVYEIFERVRTGRSRLNDIRETIRLGLIGGGKNPIQALALVKRYVDGRPLAESLPVATALLLAAIVGVPGDEVGKKKQKRTRRRPRVEAEAPGSSAPQSMASAPPSDGHHEQPTSIPSGNSAPASTAGTRSTDQSNPLNR